jgi:hypothetical protein
MTLVAGLILGVGLGCLNYTKAETIEHHRRWAAESGAPDPGPGLFRIGVVATLAGAGLLGFLVGSAVRSR